MTDPRETIQFLEHSAQMAELFGNKARADFFREIAAMLEALVAERDAALNRSEK